MLAVKELSKSYAAEPALSIMQQNLHFRLCSRTCTFAYAAEPALSNVSFSLNRGEVVVLLGASLTEGKYR
jgi:ABC-type multidrug transport system ATPase subunit